MRALVCHKLCEDFSGVNIRDVPTPVPGPGEVLIKVRATSNQLSGLAAVSGKVSAETRTAFSRRAWTFQAPWTRSAMG